MTFSPRFVTTGYGEFWRVETEEGGYAYREGSEPVFDVQELDYREQPVRISGFGLYDFHESSDAPVGVYSTKEEAEQEILRRKKEDEGKVVNEPSPEPVAPEFPEPAVDKGFQQSTPPKEKKRGKKKTYRAH